MFHDFSFQGFFVPLSFFKAQTLKKKQQLDGNPAVDGKQHQEPDMGSPHWNAVTLQCDR